MEPQRSEVFQRDRRQQAPALTPCYNSRMPCSPRLALWSLQSSLSEVTGPVFVQNEVGPPGDDLILNHAKTGKDIHLRGTARRSFPTPEGTP